ncbi:MAG TPA: MauE/DoxX family redox-associated membrane protein [Vicinamibacterales bacterium]|nr:MauE/DoxX family redox-associated membrane protein [Vicinamibacterales bacterium]
MTPLAVRLFLAAVFLLSGATKLVDPAGTRQALHDFGLPPALAGPMVPLLPGLELVTAGALLPASLAWYGAWGALALIAVFLVAIGIAMARGRRPNCHCFGQLQSAPVGWWTVLRNGVLATCAGWLASGGQGHSGPELWTWVASLDSHGRKVALVLGCLAGLLFLLQIDRSRPQPAEPSEWSFPLDFEDEAAPAERPAPAPRRRAAQGPTEGVQPARTHPKSIGLPIGTPAPEFELPGLDGEKRSLRSLRELGDVLLVFSSPFCESCETLTSNLVRWTREMEGLPRVVLVNVGTAKDNLAKLTGFDAARVLLQPRFDVAEMYDCGVTPAAVLVGADGLIRSGLAVGGQAIRELVSSCAKGGVGTTDASVEHERHSN